MKYDVLRVKYEKLFIFNTLAFGFLFILHLRRRGDRETLPTRLEDGRLPGFTLEVIKVARPPDAV